MQFGYNDEQLILVSQLLGTVAKSSLGVRLFWSCQSCLLGARPAELFQPNLFSSQPVLGIPIVGVPISRAFFGLFQARFGFITLPKTDSFILLPFFIILNTSDALII